MPRRLALVAPLFALAIVACAPAEPPLLIDETNAPAALGGDDGSTPVELAAGYPPRTSGEDEDIAR